MSTKKRQKQLAEINAGRAKKNSPAGSVKRLDDPLVRDRIAEADSYRVINHCASPSSLIARRSCHYLHIIILITISYRSLAKGHQPRMN